ncbi:MAG: hypothetical protein RIF33_01950 [Cyclobacteriaceae bacterium]
MTSPSCSSQFSILLIFSLLSWSFAIAQQDRAADLANKLESYYGARSEEKVHLHTSTQVTTAGRQLHFQAYVVDALSNQPTELSKVLRVELWNEELTRKYVTQRIKIKDGLAQGTVDIPKQLSAGQYELRAFTQWMLNFGQVTAQPIVIDKSGEFKVQDKTSDDLIFFSEGGHLIAGVVNKIAVKTVGAAQGGILNNKDKEVATFSTNTEGLGVFVMVPDKGQQYSVDIGDESRKYSFPLVEEKGLAFLLKPTSSGYRMNLQTSKSLQRELANGNISIIVEAQGIVYFSIAGDIKKTGYFIADLESSLMPHGPARISVFDSQNNLMAERPFYNVKDKSSPAHISLSKNNATRRDRVDLAIFNDTDAPLSASVSVTKVDQLVAQLPTINTFDLSNALSASVQEENLDLLMLTDTWKPATWSEIFKSTGRTTPQDFRAEQLLAYDGIARDIDGQGLVSETLDIWLINHDQVYQTKTNEKGEFNLVLFDFSDQDDFLFSSPSGRLESIEMNAWPEQLKASRAHDIVAVAEKDYSYKRKINQVYDFYRKDDQENSGTDKLDLSTTADYSVDLDKYIEFNSMQEMFVEVVAGVLLRDDATLRVYIDKDGVYADRKPLFFVNGMPTYDEQWVLDLDPLDIDMISVLNTEETLRKYKSVGQYGIVDIKLKEDLQPTPPDNFIENLEGLSNYMAPVYARYDEEQNHSRLPDLREVLYWEAPVSLDGTGRHDISFFTSDVVGTYQVKVEGMSADGRFFTLTDLIQVDAIVE